MGILDEAIKEHLELKRQHGAGESELQKLEDEAFGASERPDAPASPPDPVAEAPTQFMAQPELEATEEKPETEAAASATVDEPSASRGRTEIADLQEPPVESVDAAEEAPAEEHEAIAEPPADPEPADPEPTAPSTEERHAIAEQPTEMYDVEAELGKDEPAEAEPEVHAAPQEDALSEEDEEFWDEKRLSDELDQALEAPVELREPDLPEPEAQGDPQAEEPPPAEEPPAPPATGTQDVLDETPDFLEEKPEDADLWFEQKPPKDFDFDD